eukprot:TRINITY_DN39410_c0_g2_i1.p1 TRINITY_DN39410_c0_g2~~TRINITY_DN39410_c0_g2_i1.p1  ORF type:complete len:295 (+),score=48.10 TRINITY_DN39410_c0_g2_i1:84-968(+)
MAEDPPSKRSRSLESLENIAEDAKEQRHSEIADRVEESNNNNNNNNKEEVQHPARFVKISEREDDTDMSIDTLEALYIGQARSVWKGVPFGKSAFDWQIYACMISEVKPHTIIDLGSWAGGSALFFADFAEMLVGESFQKVVSLDITLKNVRQVAKEHPKIEFFECSTEHLKTVFTEELCSKLPHPWIISEDSHYHFDKALEILHPLIQPGDYLVCEDTSTQMHDWFEANLDKDRPKEEVDHTRHSIKQLRDTASILKEFCLKHSDLYLCDTKYTDMFGYNVGKHWNSIIKRVS